MQRVLKTTRVAGHQVSVVESLDEDGPSYLLCVDGVVINVDSPPASVPSDAMIRAAVLRWSQRTRTQPR